MRLLNSVLIGVMFLLCGLRVGQEFLRIVYEPVHSFHPEIVACSSQPREMEALVVWSYRNLGVVCTK
jgi:hypothetical protein